MDYKGVLVAFVFYGFYISFHALRLGGDAQDTSVRVSRYPEEPKDFVMTMAVAEVVLPKSSPSCMNTPESYTNRHICKVVGR